MPRKRDPQPEVEALPLVEVEAPQPSTSTSAAAARGLARAVEARTVGIRELREQIAAMEARADPREQPSLQAHRHGLNRLLEAERSDHDGRR